MSCDRKQLLPELLCALLLLVGVEQSIVHRAVTKYHNIIVKTSDWLSFRTENHMSVFAMAG